VSPGRTLHPPGRSWLPAFVVMTLLWGFSFYFIALSLRSFAPAQVAFGRVLVGALLLLAVLAVRRVRPQLSRRQWLDVAVVGVALCAAPFLLNSTAQIYVTSVLAGLLNATMPLFTAVFIAILIPRERSDLRGVVGLLIGFIGIAVLLGVWQVGSSSVLGAGLILGATACYGFGTMYTRLRFSHTHVAPLVLPALQLVCATVVVGATVAASSTYLIPLVSTTLGVLALHESLAWYEPVGGAIILLGVALTQRAATRQARFEASVDVERALAIWGG